MNAGGVHSLELSGSGPNPDPFKWIDWREALLTGCERSRKRPAIPQLMVLWVSIKGEDRRALEARIRPCGVAIILHLTNFDLHHPDDYEEVIDVADLAHEISKAYLREFLGVVTIQRKSE